MSGCNFADISMIQHEELQQRYLFQWAAFYPQLRWLHAIPNGGKRNKIVAAKLKAGGVKSGVLDVFLPLARHGFHGLYIEMKHGKNKLTDNQQAFAAHIEAEGYKYAVCYHWSEAQKIICDYVGISCK